MQQRGLPLGIVLCALAMGISGVLFVVFSLPLLALSSTSMWGTIFLVLGVFNLAAAYGLFRLLSWAWGLTIILNILGIILSLVLYAIAPIPQTYSGNSRSLVDIVGFLISIAIILYLLRPSVRARFKSV